jgi:hypothetical protein
VFNSLWVVVDQRRRHLFPCLIPARAAVGWGGFPPILQLSDDENQTWQDAWAVLEDYHPLLRLA